MRCYFYIDRGLCIVELIDTTDDTEAIARAKALFEERRNHFRPPITSFELMDAACRLVYQHSE